MGTKIVGVMLHGVNWKDRNRTEWSERGTRYAYVRGSTITGNRKV